MKRFLKTLIFIPIFLFLVNNLAVANIQEKEQWKLESLNGLKNVYSHLMKNGHIVRLEFKKPVVERIEPVFYKKSVQIDFPKAFVSPSKKSFNAESSLISKVFATQFDNSTLRIRLHIKPGVSDIKKRFKLVQQGRFIIIRFDSKKSFPSYLSSNNKSVAKSKKENLEIMNADELAQFLKRASKKIKNEKFKLPSQGIRNPSSIKAKEKQSFEINSEVKVKRAGIGVAPIVDQIKRATLGNTNEDKKVTKSKKTNSSITTKESVGFDLKSSMPTGKRMEFVPSGMKMISMFAVVLGLMFLVFFGFKKYVLKNTAFGRGDKLVSVLGTWFIGPKKNIALVEIAGEVLVLGVSQENITLLSSITSEKKIEEIKNIGIKGKGGMVWDSNHAEKIQDRKSTNKENVVGQFSKYLSKFSKAQEVKEKLAADAKEQILQKIGKMKTAKA